MASHLAAEAPAQKKKASHSEEWVTTTIWLFKIDVSNRISHQSLKTNTRFWSSSVIEYLLNIIRKGLISKKFKFF